jgi:sortase A
MRWLEGILMVAGCTALAYCMVVTGVAASTRVTSIASAKNPWNDAATRALSPEKNTTSQSGSSVIGEIRIPQLSLAAPITDGIGRIELIRGIGHIPGTAFPGGLGTMGLAGHRDTFFRPLRRVTPGMSIRVTGESGTYRYQVDSTEIVSPEKVSVLNIGSQPKLVLVTCYPFNFLGAAPLRFVVHAHLLSLAPESN